jgi:hexulose-6-phosphate isomerase
MTNRRQFLSSSALAASAATLPSALPTTSSAGEMNGILKKAVKFTMIQEPDMSVVDKFKMLKELGFDGTELRTEYNVDYKMYRDALDKSDFHVHGIVNSNKPDLTTAVKFSSDMGGDSVLYVAKYDRKKPLMDSWNETIAIIRTGLDAAAEHKVKNPWFGAYYDVGNNVRWGIPQHWIQILGNRIGKLDIKEWDEKKHSSEGLRAGFGSELGEGTIDWAAVRAALREIGYKGWATAEVKGGNRERLADIARRMDNVLGLG